MLDAAARTLGDLIAYPTVSTDQNVEMIEHLADRLAAAGARVEIQRHEEEPKANLYAVIGPEAPGGVLLSGHTDVVPVTDQDWSSDPFVMAERDGAWVAGAMNMIGRETLFGRYWGCIELHACLHFELCYYRALDFAIAHGLKRVEAGAQGDHKLARGYLPVQTHALYWIADENFRAAIERFVEAEREAIDEEIEVLTAYGPFRKDNREEQD